MTKRVRLKKTKTKITSTKSKIDTGSSLFQLSEDLIVSFQQKIYGYFYLNGRSFPWRQTFNPYHIVVSEIMLQQTQTHRVLKKYEQFIETFPRFESLAAAPLQDVLSVWQGLGYNRRGKALHEVAKIVVEKFNGILPNDPEILDSFPGIGPATAASITAFAFNRSTVFIETNIRAVYIHHFFTGRTDVHDNEIYPLVEQTLDLINPRHWYYALMDYGVMLKKQFANPARKSVHHAKQSKFEGSDRQIRGAVIRVLTQTESLRTVNLFKLVANDLDKKIEKDRFTKIIDQLSKEGLISKQGSQILIST